MNRSVDSRSDLYALGVTFYELLTGALPFTAADPIELIHCHIAREPVPPGELASAVPAPLSMIVMKLLAKTAEERYQTAAGVEADLRKCLTAWESIGRIDPFPLGLQDASDRLMIPEKLYGREGEIATLLAAFDRVVMHGGSELVLVSGYSGIGKSSVVNELHKVIVLPRGIFISGKFDLRLRDTPHSTLAQAFQGLIQQLLNGQARRHRPLARRDQGSCRQSGPPADRPHSRPRSTDRPTADRGSPFAASTPNYGFRPCSSGSSACLRGRNTRSSFSSMTCNGSIRPR